MDCGFFFLTPIFLFVSSSSDTPESWAGLSCLHLASSPLHGFSGSCKGSKGTLWHAELFQPRSLPQLLETFSLAVCRSFPALKSTWVFSSHSELCVLTSSVPVSLFQIFLGEFSASFCRCFFILFCINNTGRGWRGRGEGSFTSAGVFPNRFIIINLPMLFPSLKASWFIITMKKEEPFVQ